MQRPHRPGKIDAILKAEEYVKIMLQDLKESDEGVLRQITEFGWNLSGFITVKKVTSMGVCSDEDHVL